MGCVLGKDDREKPKAQAIASSSGSEKQISFYENEDPAQDDKADKDTDAAAANVVDVGVLRRCRVFESATAEQLAKVVPLLQVEVVPSNSILYREGDDNDKWYILARGSAVVTVKDGFNFPVEVGRISTCSAFGESALFINSKHYTTVSTLATSVFYSLRPKKLGKLTAAVPSVARELEFNALRREAMKSALENMDVFNRLSQDKWLSLLEMCQLRTYPVGSSILEEGRVDSKKLYIIASGTVDIYVNDRRLRTLGKNSYFGEVSLMSDKPHSATVVVSGTDGQSGAVVLEIDKGGFLRFLAGEEGVLSEFRVRVAGRNCSLRDVLHHTKGREILEGHLAKEFSVENIQFLVAVGNFENMKKSLIRKKVLRSLGSDPEETRAIKKQIRESKAREIFDTFLARNAPNQVNVPGTIVEDILSSMEKGDMEFDLFKKAESCIYNLLQDDAWQRFQKSNEFSNLLSTVGAYENLNLKEQDLYSSASLRRGTSTSKVLQKPVLTASASFASSHEDVFSQFHEDLAPSQVLEEQD